MVQTRFPSQHTEVVYNHNYTLGYDLARFHHYSNDLERVLLHTLSIAHNFRRLANDFALIMYRVNTLANRLCVVEIPYTQAGNTHIARSPRYLPYWVRDSETPTKHPPSLAPHHLRKLHQGIRYGTKAVCVHRAVTEEISNGNKRLSGHRHSQDVECHSEDSKGRTLQFLQARHRRRSYGEVRNNRILAFSFHRERVNNSLFIYRLSTRESQITASPNTTISSRFA